jgi:hypothetical protein
MYTQVAFEAGIKLETLALLKPATRINVMNELWEPHRELAENDERKLLVEANETGGFDVRAMNSAKYERLWDDEVFAEVDQHLLSSGWEPAYPTFNIDPGTPVEKRERALVRTPRYSFCFFMTQPKHRAGQGFSNQKAEGMTGSAAIAAEQGFEQVEELGGLRKGLMVYNGETGHKSFGWQMFLFRNVCHNFNIWDLQEGRTKRVRHTKSVRDAFQVFKEDCKSLKGELAEFEIEFLRKSAKLEFAKEDEDAIKRLNRYGVTLAHARAAVEAAKLEINGANLSIWSVVNGITWHAKTLQNEDDRVALSVLAGSVLNAAMSDEGITAGK